jgi:hypothetical protein
MAATAVMTATNPAKNEGEEEKSVRYRTDFDNRYQRRAVRKTQV